ncbi:MAG: AAA family ATPase [Desulfovibrio sp.]|nr:AAA family ATPase [Desulfovibrio sp.]
MPPVSPLPAGKLRVYMDPARLPWSGSDSAPIDRSGASFRALQPRAIRALELATGPGSGNFHVYLSGAPGLGRTRSLLNWLKPVAEKGSAAPDLLYVNNFEDPDQPRLISMPAGEGAKFRDAVDALLRDLRDKFAVVLDSEKHSRRRTAIIKTYSSRKDDLWSRMRRAASKKGYDISLDDSGEVSVASKTRRFPGKSRPIAPDELLADDLFPFSREGRELDEAWTREETSLFKDAMDETLAETLDPVKERFLALCPSENLENYFKGLRAHILADVARFLPPEKDAEDEPRPGEDREALYRVNLFVDNSEIAGAPVVVEDNPSFANLMGCMERESEMGALITNPGLIRAGAIHRANGGYLILHVDDLVQRPYVWDALLRSLRTGFAPIEDNAELSEFSFRVKSPRPEPAPLALKVILIGDEDYYEILLDNDDRFARLFRIKAHLTDQLDRTAPNLRLFLTEIAKIIRAENLCPFDASGLARVADHSSFLCEDQKKLSLKFPLLRETLIEASALARERDKKMVDAEILDEVLSAKNYRENLLQEVFMEDYNRDLIKLPVSGSAIGQVNGLSVVMSGDYEFGLPQKITCAVGVGHDGVIDLEREADLGGPIHTKAMLILKSYLTNLFASKKPLVLSASLYFEQSYGGIEGDSASGAELAALLSALAETPVRLDLAFTGAVSSTGQILAVGGVAKKIEGFYRLCARRGFTGTQGVIIPHSNIDHLLLPADIIASAEKGEFHIYSVKTMDEALLLLTGLPVGKRRKDGSFTPKSLFDRVDRRLDAFGYSAQNAFRRRRKD